MSKRLRFFVPSGTQKQPLQNVYFPKLGIMLSDKKYPEPCAVWGNFELIWADRRSIPDLLSEGLGDVGITGYDIYLEYNCKTGKELRTVVDLPFTRAGNDFSRLVFVSRPECVERQARFVVTEYPNLCRRVLCESLPEVHCSITQIDGNEEMWLAEQEADSAFIVSDTGNSIARLGLVEVEAVKSIRSCPRIFTRQPTLGRPVPRCVEDFAWALRAVVLAKKHVMVTFDIPKEALSYLDLPSEVSPTAMDLYGKPDWVAGTICIDREEFGRVGRKIEKAGGRAIVMQDVEAYQEGKKDNGKDASPRRYPDSPAPPPRPDDGSYRH
ncbi:MAG: hypothetical protein ABIA92_04825 [Patescibacteria group bacterium]